MRLARRSRWRWRWPALESKSITPSDRINCPGYLDLGNARFHCWRKDGHGSLDLRGGLKNSCDVFFYETARRTGIDRIAAMANRFGLGTELDIDLPGARTGFIPTREWRDRPGPCVEHRRHHRLRHRPGLHPGDAPAARHLCGARRHRPQGAAASDAQARPACCNPARSRRTGRPGPDRSAILHVVREGMWAVVNEPGGTAPLARLPDRRWQMAGKTGSSQVRRVSREQREQRQIRQHKLPWEFRPHALFVAYAPYDAPRYALSVVVEHGNAGAAVAGPIARDIMMDVLQRDPGGRDEAAGPHRSPRRRRRAMREGRLWRETWFDLGGKIWQISWLMCCCSARWPASAMSRCTAPRRGAGALRLAPRAAVCRRSGADDRHRAGRYPLHRPAGVADLSGRRWRCWCWWRATAMSARARSAGSRSAACRSSHPN